MKNSISCWILTCLILSIFVIEYYVVIPSFTKPIEKVVNHSNSIHLRQQVACTIHKNSLIIVDIEDEEDTRKFSIIIVTFNEALLNKTVNNVLQNSNPKYFKEIVIIDDCSTIPVAGWENDTRVRIIRPDHNLGLINARILGANNAAGDFIAFIDAHVFVSPRWLNTPYKLLSENPKTIVNFVNLKLDPDTYKPQTGSQGAGSSASFTWGFGIFWGGGSRDDDFSPITMGMFAITKYWWNQGQMDSGMGRWGGENIEISLRTWLCGGQIRVAKDSYVAHAFRHKFPYKVNNNDIQRNNLRAALVWLDGPYLENFLKKKKISIVNGKSSIDYGDISERLALKKRLNCKPFSWYVDFFKNRAPCSPSERTCGGIDTVSASSLPKTVKELFY